MKYDRLTIAAAAAAAGVALAVLGPWLIGPFGITVTGLDVDTVGVAALGLGLVSAARAAFAGMRPVNLAEAAGLSAVGVLATTSAIYFIARIETLAPNAPTSGTNLMSSMNTPARHDPTQGPRGRPDRAGRARPPRGRVR